MFDLPPVDCGIIHPVLVAAGTKSEMDIEADIQVVMPGGTLDMMRYCELPGLLYWIDEAPSADALTALATRAMVIVFRPLESGNDQSLELEIEAQRWDPGADMYWGTRWRIRLSREPAGWAVVEQDIVELVD